MEKIENLEGSRNEESLTLEEVQRKIEDFRRMPSLTVEQEKEWRRLISLEKDILSKEK